LAIAEALWAAQTAEEAIDLVWELAATRVSGQRGTTLPLHCLYTALQYHALYYVIKHDD
jgi:hypothetical protein